MLNYMARQSNLKCMQCKRASGSTLWECECGLRWRKCRLHTGEVVDDTARVKPKPKLKKRKQVHENGVDKPLPKKRRDDGLKDHLWLDEISMPKAIRIPANGRLAIKFPQFVVGSTERGVQGTSSASC